MQCKSPLLAPGELRKEPIAEGAINSSMANVLNWFGSVDDADSGMRDLFAFSEGGVATEIVGLSVGIFWSEVTEDVVLTGLPDAAACGYGYGICWYKTWANGKDRWVFLGDHRLRPAKWRTPENGLWRFGLGRARISQFWITEGGEGFPEQERREDKGIRVGRCFLQVIVGQQDHQDFWYTVLVISNPNIIVLGYGKDPCNSDAEFCKSEGGARFYTCRSPNASLNTTSVDHPTKLP